MSVKVFYSYSHKDKELLDQLVNHLQKQGVITGWHDERITAGTEWADDIDKRLNTAHVILLLISSDFLASDYCNTEVEKAMKRHHAGRACVIPIILCPCDWSGAPFSKLQALPKDAKAVTSWENPDEAFTDISKGIRSAVETIKTEENLERTNTAQRASKTEKS